MPKHIVLAYSGGLDTSVAIRWLKTTYKAKVTACLVNMGQAGKDLADAKARAVANGAEDCVVTESRTAFAEEFLAPAIKANALYEGAYPLATALSRPLIARELVRVARDVGGDAVAHGCTGKGNDQVRIETGVRALAPGLECIAPQRIAPMTRDAAVEYAKKHGLKLAPIRRSPYSTDENMWGRSVEGGDIEDPAEPVPEEAYAWTTSAAKAPDAPGVFTIGFDGGVPVSLGGKGRALADLCETLNAGIGKHGVGRIDHVENRLVGIKSREVYEAPAATAILAAKKALETLTLTRDEFQFKPVLEAKFAACTYDGLWYSPTMKAVNAFVDTVQENVTGTATVSAFKGALTVTGRESPNSLYKTNLATYGAKDSFDHQASAGFITIWSLPLETAGAVRQAAASKAAATGKAKKSTKG